MKKLTLKMFSVLFVLCAILSMFFMLNNTYVQAEETSTPIFSETKYKISTDNRGMIIATGISNYADVYKVGYAFFDEENNDITSSISAINSPNKNYYTSIKSGDNVWTVTDMFGDEYTGMIVWEINYELEKEYIFKAYAYLGERIDGELWETGDVVYGQSRTVSASVYEITFKNADGEILQQSSVATGQLPVYSGATPTMADDAQYTYGDFTGWDTEIDVVTGDKVYTATYNNKQVNKYTVTVSVNNAEFGTVSNENIANVPYGTNIVIENNTITANGMTITATANNEKYFFIDWTCDVETVTGDVTVTANFGEKFNLNGTISMHRNAENTKVAEGTDLALYNGETLVKTVKVGANGAFDFGSVIEGNYTIKLATAKDYAVELTADKDEQNILVEYDMFKSSNAWNSANANDGNIEMNGVADLVFNNQSEDFYLEFIYKMRETDTTGSGKDARAYVKFLDENGGHYGVRILESANNATGIAFCEWADDYEVSWSGYTFSADEQARIKGDGLKIAVIRLDGYIYVYTENVAKGNGVVLDYRFKTEAKSANDSYMFRGWQVYALSGLRYVDNYDAKQITLLGSGNYYQVPNYDQMQNGSIVNYNSINKQFKTQYENFVMEFDFSMISAWNSGNRLYLRFNHDGKNYDITTIEGTKFRILFKDNNAGTGITSDNEAAGTRYWFDDNEVATLKAGASVNIKIQRLNGVLTLWVNGVKRLEITLPSGFENDTISFLGSALVYELQNFTYTEIK